MNKVRKIVKEEVFRFLLEKSKEYGGNEPDFESWGFERARKYWKSMGGHIPPKKGDFRRVLEKVKEGDFTDDPEAFVSTLEKKATGKWPSEKRHKD